MGEETCIVLTVCFSFFFVFFFFNLNITMCVRDGR